MAADQREDSGMDGRAGRVRCAWARSGIERAYHDREWGVVERDDARLF
ncbi:MAG: hypothetical protein ACIARR_12770 [Phycisphaerales bacterium JB059]